MARRIAHPRAEHASTRSNDRVATDAEGGAVYVEFLFAFFPVFLLFLAICQLALLASARLVVQHAALSAVRSAIVVLEESPDDFGGVERGWLSTGSPGPGVEQAIGALHLGSVAAADLSGPKLFGQSLIPQQGARMAPIRASAYLPLLALAPAADALSSPKDDSIARSLPGGFARRMAAAIEYTRAAAVITVHTGPGTNALPAEPIDPNAPITVRVTYLYPCSVPVVRALVCKSLSSLLGPPGEKVYDLYVGAGNSALRKHYELAEGRGQLEAMAAADARFVLLTGEATLPNQGAAYTRAKAEND